MSKRLLLIAVVLICKSYEVSAQSTCAQTLRLAQSVYDQGRLHELPQLLQECIKSGFTDAEKVNAYKLLALTYIYLEEPEKADQTMLALLRTDSEFKINDAVDPAEFVALYNTFRTTPIYRIGGSISGNASQPNAISFNPVNDGSGAYKYKLGFGVGLSFELPIKKRLTGAAELNFNSKSFSAEYKTSSNTSDYSTTTGVEKQGWLSIPLTVQYQINEKKFQPFVRAGVATDLLLSSNITGEKKQSGFQSVEAKSFDLKPQRQKINISALLGFGIKTKIKGGYLLGELRYSYGITKINSSSTLLANQSLLFDYGYIDGIYRLSSISAHVSYVRNVFNPKKKKIRK
jgi:hypothetical protein